MSNLVKKRKKHINLGNSNSIRSDSISIGRALDHNLRFIFAKNDNTFQVYELESGIDRTSNFRNRLPDRVIDLTTIISPDDEIPELDRVAVVVCQLCFEE